MVDECPDCGSRRYSGTCPWCQEELYIYETQAEFRPDNLSAEFMDLVREQEMDRSRRRSERVD